MKEKTELQKLAKKARAKSEMTQLDFAHFVGYSYNTIKSWEQGWRTPPRAVQLMLNGILTDQDFYKSLLNKK